MNKTRRCVVIVPESRTKSERFPTVYLLHGHGGKYSNWIEKVPQIKPLADEFRMIIVMPDGEHSSWYVDSPIDSTMKYETYISQEVPTFIDARYPTINNRNARAITGLSMGGHGGLFLGFRHAHRFGACGSMSGALGIEYITRGFSVEKRLGDTSNKERYREYSIFKQMETYPKDSVAIIIDCGVDDFVIQMSRMAHSKMLDLKIPHEYVERPGKHDWKYWANAIKYQLFFFREYFDKAAKK